MKFIFVFFVILLADNARAQFPPDDPNNPVSLPQRRSESQYRELVGTYSVNVEGRQVLAAIELYQGRLTLKYILLGELTQIIFPITAVDHFIEGEKNHVREYFYQENNVSRIQITKGLDRRVLDIRGITLKEGKLYYHARTLYQKRKYWVAGEWVPDPTAADKNLVVSLVLDRVSLIPMTSYELESTTSSNPRKYHTTIISFENRQLEVQKFCNQLFPGGKTTDE